MLGWASVVPMLRILSFPFGFVASLCGAVGGFVGCFVVGGVLPILALWGVAGVFVGWNSGFVTAAVTVALVLGACVVALIAALAFGWIYWVLRGRPDDLDPGWAFRIVLG
jgi:hypothetical protein